MTATRFLTVSTALLALTLTAGAADVPKDLPIIGRWDALGALQDFFALAVATGILTFAIIRLRTEPEEYGRQSRFYGSHTGGAWLILFMIFNVIWTYAIFRGASVNALGDDLLAVAHEFELFALVAGEVGGDLGERFVRTK